MSSHREGAPPAASASDAEIEHFLCAIHRRYGYDFRDYSPPSTSRRVVEAVKNHGASSVRELLDWALADPSFFERMLPALTVPVTELCRDPSAFWAIRSRVLPHLRTYPRIRVWHAGCATGEEVYSLAVMLAEEDLLERSLLYGTDINTVSLERARLGRISAGDLAGAHERHLEAGGRRFFGRHVTEDRHGLVFARRLRDRLIFAEHNLVTDTSFGEMHLIVCRNVLIYFAPPLRRRVLSLFAASLARGGFLWLGAGEDLPEGPEAEGFTPFVRAARIFRHGSPTEPARARAGEEER